MSGQYGDVVEFAGNLVDQALEQVGHSGVHDRQDRRADDHDDEYLHGHVQIALAAAVTRKGGKASAEGLEAGTEALAATGIQGNQFLHWHLSISLLLG